MASSSFSERSCRSVEGWHLHEFDAVPSTNPVAGALPAWHAVRADLQTLGRGRTGRVWVSDLGGLWISCVIPAPGPRKKWSILPLGTGWAVIGALELIGVQGLRLRWPNDILLGRRKLAGLLVEQYQPETAVIGVGINITNRPDGVDPALDGRTVNLQELTRRPVSIESVASLLLGALRRLQGMIEQDRFPEIVADINQRWGDPRRVEISLNNQGRVLPGFFRGVDENGRLNFSDDAGNTLFLEACQVGLLREIE